MGETLKSIPFPIPAVDSFPPQHGIGCWNGTLPLAQHNSLNGTPRKFHGSRTRNPHLLPKDGLQSAGEVIFLVVYGFLSHGNLHVGITLEAGTEIKTKFPWDCWIGSDLKAHPAQLFFTVFFPIPIPLPKKKIFWEFTNDFENGEFNSS